MRTISEAGSAHVKAVLLGGWVACLLAGCQSGYEQRGHLDAASQAFVRRMHYPYIASPKRRRQIERASRLLHVEMSNNLALKTRTAGVPQREYNPNGNDTKQIRQAV